MSLRHPKLANAIVALLALCAIALSGWNLLSGRSGVVTETIRIGDTPATIFRPKADPAARSRPVVVIAHGFAGSQQLMQPFALTFARNGYVAVTFDFYGHGRNGTPLGGSITELHGATRVLVDQTAAIADLARSLGDGRLAVLGHSMASDIVIRFALDAPAIAATIAVSPFSEAVTPTSPRNLLLLVGGWETFLKEASRRLVAQVSGTTAPADDTTYGDFTQGNARRLAVAPGVEHVTVLYSRASMAESLAWLDAASGTKREAQPELDRSGPWIALLLAALVLLVRPLSALLPQVSARPLGAGLPWRRLWPALVIPAILTPLILRVVPTRFLPILVADYLAVHFLVLGLLTFVAIRFAARGHAPAVSFADRPARLLLAAGLATLIGLGPLALAIDTYVTSFVPVAGRGLLLGAMLLGTLSYCLANEWLTRGEGAGRGAYALSQVAFLLSLVLAIALDFERLFFLAIIVPVIVPVLLVFGLFSHWFYRRTNHPVIGAFANAVAFAVAIGVTFPMLAG